MSIRDTLQKMKFMLLLVFCMPIIIMAVTGLLWPNELIYGVIFAVIVEIPLIISYRVLRDLHNKKIEESKKYQGVVEYVKIEMVAEKKRRREKFLQENNKFNKMDALYFGKPVPTDEFSVNKPSKETMHQDVTSYLEGMGKNLFGAKLFQLLNKVGIDEYTLCKKAHLNRIILDYLRDPSYHIRKKDAIALALALELSMGSTQELLEQAGYALDKLREYDCAICFFIEKGLYNLEYINLELCAAGYEEFN